MWPHITAAAQVAGPAPMFTWREGDSRIELSGVTFLNAVSKAANFLVDGLEVEEEQSVYVSLGNHWQSPVWMAAVVAAGAVISDKPCDINIANASQSSELNGTVAVVTRDPFGMPDRDLPTTVVNASAEVRGFGDYFSPRTTTEDSTLLTTWGVNVQQAKLLVNELASTYGISRREAVAITCGSNVRTNAEWHCLFSLFYQSPTVLLDGIYDREKD